MTLNNLDPAFLMELKLQLLVRGVNLDKVRISATPLHPFAGLRVSVGAFYDPHWDIQFRGEPILDANGRTLIGNIEVASEIAKEIAGLYGG